MKHIYVLALRRARNRVTLSLKGFREHDRKLRPVDSQRPRQAIPGQLHRINRADESSFLAC
jgi:hypothetical protein